MSEVVDLHIGKRLRARRRLLNLTQSELGSICGVSFQQIQKYESAANHVSAALLWRLAVGLGVGVQYFYDGLDCASTAKVTARGPSAAPTRADEALAREARFG